MSNTAIIEHLTHRLDHAITAGDAEAIEDLVLDLATNGVATCQFCHGVVEFGRTEFGHRGHIHVATGKMLCG